MSVACPLCYSDRVGLFHRDSRRSYQRCHCCALVFVPATYWLDPVAEKAVYDQHCNSPDDAGYRQFLNRLAEPLSKQLAPGCRGLDFGSGPGPTLSVMLAEAGHQVDCFDQYYAPDNTWLQHYYDFITATEVVEHLRQPRAVLDQLWSQLLPGGVLGLMTKLVQDQQAFQRWHYILDPTHIIFFSAETLAWLAAHFGATLTRPAADVMLFRKPSINDR